MFGRQSESFEKVGHIKMREGLKKIVGTFPKYGGGGPKVPNFFCFLVAIFCTKIIQKCYEAYDIIL